MTSFEAQSFISQIKVEKELIDLEKHAKKKTNPFASISETFPGLSTPLVRNNKILVWPGTEKISDSVQEGKTIVQVESALRVSLTLENIKVPAKLKHFELLFFRYQFDNIDEVVVLTTHRGLFLDDIFSGYSAGVKTRESFMTEVYGVNRQPFVAQLYRISPRSDENYNKVVNTTLSLVSRNLAENVLQYFIL